MPPVWTSTFHKLLAGLAVVAQDGLHLLRFVGCRQKDAFAADGGRRMAAAGHLGLPEHVFVLAPLQRRLLLGRGDTVARRAAPPRPIRR